MAGNDSNRIAIAIVVAAILIAGTIFLVTRPPDECAEWNEEMATLSREAQSLIEANEAAPGSVGADEANDLRSRYSRHIAELPDDCVGSQEVLEEFEKLGV